MPTTHTDLARRPCSCPDDTTDPDPEGCLRHDPHHESFDPPEPEFVHDYDPPWL